MKRQSKEKGKMLNKASYRDEVYIQSMSSQFIRKAQFFSHKSYLFQQQFYHLFFHILMILFICLIVLASAQQCPYCEWNACTITSQGLGNCSSCSQGALVQVQAGLSFGSSFTETIGMCVLCMTGCSACTYGEFAAAMAPISVGIYCTSCNAGYAYNYVYGNCSLCPANCLSCQCNGDTCYEMMCLTCASGYTVGGISANFTCVASSTSALEGDDEAGSALSRLNIGLAVWGAIMTVTAVVFIVLFIKNRAKSNSVGMLNAELKEVRASF